MVFLCELFHRIYGWSLAEVDATELAYLFSLLRVKALSGQEPEQKTQYIDEVL